MERNYYGNYTWMLYICCFEQILEVTLKKIAVVRILTSHLVNHIRKANKTRLPFLEKYDELIINIFKWIPTHGHTSVGRPTKTYFHQLYDPLLEWSDRDEWRMIVQGIRVVSMPCWWWWLGWYKNISCFCRFKHRCLISNKLFFKSCLCNISFQCANFFFLLIYINDLV